MNALEGVNPDDLIQIFLNNKASVQQEFEALYSKLAPDTDYNIGCLMICVLWNGFIVGFRDSLRLHAEARNGLRLFSRYVDSVIMFKTAKSIPFKTSNCEIAK